MSSEEDLFGDEMAVDPTPPSLGSTPLEFSDAAASPVIAHVQTKQKAAGHHVCSICNNTLSSKSSLKRHMLLHTMNEYANRKPFEDQIRAALPKLFQEVLNSILQEPLVSEYKSYCVKFIEAFLQLDENNLQQLLEVFSSSILDIVLVKSKVLPSAQLEESMKKHHKFVCSSNFFEEARAKMLDFIPDSLKVCPSSLLQGLIWRISFLLLLKIQEFIFHSMRQQHKNASQIYVMGEFEREVFLKHVATLLRATFKFGIKTKNSVWRLRCRCLLEKFVLSATGLTEGQFVDPELWSDQTICLAQPSIELFLGLERILQSFQSNAAPFSSNDVLNSLAKPENMYILDQIRILTQGILGEVLAVDFLHDLIVSLTGLSGKLDAKQKAAEAKRKQKVSNVPTRTNLKRNMPAQPDPEELETANPKEKQSSSKQKPKEKLKEKPKEKTKEKPKEKTKEKPKEKPSSSKQKQTETREEATSSGAKKPTQRVTKAKEQSSQKESEKVAPVQEQRTSSRKRKQTERFNQ